MKKRIAYFLLFGWMSVVCFAPLQAAQERGFFAALFDISARYFSELSSLSQVSISQQLAVLREKKIVLASDQKKQTVYKQLIRSMQRANKALRAKAVQSVAYLKTDTGK